MPNLPLPVGGAGIGAGDLPVSDGSDVLAEFSDGHRLPETAPVRDAFCEAFAVTHLTYQDAAHVAIAQTDPLRATGDFLVAKALEREIVPFVGETPASIRSRMFSAPELVSPNAIVNAINTLISPYTDKECEFLELDLDGIFVHDGTVTEWDGFFLDGNPRYPDRYYIDDAAENDGFYLENNLPGGPLISFGYRRNFHIRLPSLDAADDILAFAIDSDDEIMAIGDGSDTSGAESDGSVATSVFFDGVTAEELYAAIVNKVESIKGQGMTWSVIVDEAL